MTRLRTVELYRDAQRRVVVIEVVEISQTKFGKGGQFTASIIPMAVIVCTTTGSQVLSVDADSRKLDTMKQHHPELNDLIVAACR